MTKSTETVMYMTILLITLIHNDNVSVEGGLVGQYFITIPSNITVNSGEPTKLHCVVGNMMGTCQWTRDGFGLGSDRELSSFPRYSMSSDSEGVCDLTIDPVLPLDDGIYQCQVSGGDGSSPISSSPVRLEVNSPPGQPHIIQAREGDMVDMDLGNMVELECESHGGSPAAHIEWVDGAGKRMISDVTQHVTRIENTKMFKTVSVFRFRLQKTMKISCAARSDAFPVPKMSRSMAINIGGETVEEVKEVKDGESFEIVCSDKDETNSGFYKWFFNDIEQTSETNNKLRVEQFTKDYDNSVLKCIVNSLNGKTRLIKTVTLKYQPDIISPPLVVPKISRKEPKSFTRMNKNMKKTIFTCVAVEEEEGSEPKYVWINGGLEKKAGQDYIEASDDTNKKFVCKTIPKSFKKLKQMNVKMKSMSKTFRKFSKVLKHLTSPIDDT